MSDKIIPGQGLFQQLKKTNIHPYSVGNFSLDGIKEIVDEMQLNAWRSKLHAQLFELYSRGNPEMITEQEYENLETMINSDDQETIYIAEQIIKYKADGIQGIEEAGK